MKHFTDETKLKAVNEVLAGSTRGEVAKKYRVTTTSLDRWKKEFSSKEESKPLQETSERKAWLDQASKEDVQNLMRKYLSVTRENQLLKEEKLGSDINFTDSQKLNQLVQENRVLKEAVVELYLKQCSATKH